MMQDKVFTQISKAKAHVSQDTTKHRKHPRTWTGSTAMLWVRVHLWKV